MTIYPVVCPKCGSWEMDPVPPTGFAGLRQRIRQIGGRRLYLCEECRWRGYLVRGRLVSPWFLFLLVIIPALILFLLAL